MIGASSWIPIPGGSPFPISNLPFGVGQPGNTNAGQAAWRAWVAIGDVALDLDAVHVAGWFDPIDLPHRCFSERSLNTYLGSGPDVWSATRSRLIELLTNESFAEQLRPHLMDRSNLVMGVPTAPTDYVDFYSSLHHAVNLGRILRPDSEPFLGKSFATSVSPWLVSLEALEPFRVDPPAQDPPPAAYLATNEPWAFDLQLEVWIQSARMRELGIDAELISSVGFADMNWTPAQQLAHLTVNGASTQAGDLFGSGTVSGPQPGSEGSLIELTRNGARSFGLPDGSSRTFLLDGDRGELRGWAGDDPTTRIGLGSVAGTIVAAAPSTASHSSASHSTASHSSASHSSASHRPASHRPGRGD